MREKPGNMTAKCEIPSHTVMPPDWKTTTGSLQSFSTPLCKEVFVIKKV